MTGAAMMMASMSAKLSLGGPGGLAILSQVTSPTDAVAGFIIESDGDYLNLQQAVQTDLGDWIVPKSKAGADYEVRFSTGDSVDGGSDAINSWLSLGTTRTWTKTRTTNLAGADTVTGTIEIRQAGSGIVLASRGITITAEVV